MLSKFQKHWEFTSILVGYCMNWWIWWDQQMGVSVASWLAWDDVSYAGMMFLTLTVPEGKRMVLVCSKDGQPMHAFLFSLSLRKFLFLEVLRKAIPDQISLMFASLLLLTREINSTFFFLPRSHSRSKACFFFLHQWVCVWLISYSCIMYNDKSCVTEKWLWWVQAYKLRGWLPFCGGGWQAG